jgi:protein-disulfide isomerase
MTSAGFGAEPLIMSRRTSAALSRARLAGIIAAVVVAVLGFAQFNPVGAARAQNTGATLVTKPGSLPDLAIGSATAPVTIIEYASMTCPHCARFEENVFPMLKSKYVDTGKVRFVFREFPLDIKAAAASMLARCIAGGDAEKYFGTIDLLFKQQDQLMEQTTDTLKRIGVEAGMSEQGVDSCEKDQTQLDKIKADQDFAYKKLKIDATPTFFINGEMSKGAMSFEELDGKISSQLKK